MSDTNTNEGAVRDLQLFFDREVCRKGIAPIKNGVELGVFIDDTGPFTLEKTDKGPVIKPSPPDKPDMTFHIPAKAMIELLALDTGDVGEVGVKIVKLMAHSDPCLKIRAKVHIGLFGILTNGYLSVLPLGGGTVLRHLASMGLTSIGKIKEAIQKIRD